MVRRVTAGLGLRVAEGDVACLPLLIDAAKQLETVTKLTVASLRAQHGYSWSDIARELGVSRQAARQRWGGDSPES